MAELVSIKRNVDVSPGQAAPAVFHCSQGDVGSKIILGLLNNGTAYSIPSGVTVTIEGSESNGSIFTPISATASGSDITFYLTGEMTAVAGPAICQAVLKSGSNILGTANFTLEVESSPMGADAPPVFTDAGWTWMLNKLNTEFVPALGNETIIDAIDSKADQSDLTALSNTVVGHTGSITVLNNTVNNLNQSVTENRQNIARKLDKNQGTANAGKYLKVGTDGNIETADLDVTTDKTLSIADKAADAKAVGDELTDLKADLSDNLDFIYSSHYSKSNLPLNSATVSRGIANSGAVVYDADKTLSFYPVSAGDIVYLSLSGNTGTSTAVWEFTNVGQASSLDANDVVGSTHFDAINGNVTVPTGATYIAIAQATGSTYIIQKLIPVDYQGEIHDIKKGAYEHIVGDFERGSILNGVNSTTTTRVRHKKPVSYSHDIFLFVKSGFKYYVAFYSDAAGTTYLYTREFVSDNLPIIIKANTYFRMVICKTTEETITDINTYIDALYITTQLFSNPQIYKNNLVRQAAHQGLSSNPASTTGYCMVESYVNAAKAGFTHGELDIVFSYDGVPFCCHDATFTDATTSEPVTIASKTAEELKTYNYHGGKIATFDEVVKTCKTYGMGVYVDHLDGSWTSDKWNSLFAVIQKYNMAKNTFWLLPAVAPLLTDPITTWYQDANFVRVFTTVPSDFPTSVAAVEALKTDANIVSIDLPASAISANDMPTYAAQIPPGVELEIWTVDTVSNWYAYLPYVSGITSNRICANIARQV